MEPLCLQPVLLALLGAKVCWGDYKHKDTAEWELVQNLPLDLLPRHNTILTLGNSSISEKSLGNGPTFTVLQKP